MGRGRNGKKSGLDEKVLLLTQERLGGMDRKKSGLDE